MNDESETRLARIFVGLKINSDIADQLAALAGELRGTRARLVATSDIHLTLVPPWQEVSLDQAIGSLRKVAGMFAPFSLKFHHLGYGPQPRRPSLLWVDCAATEEFAALRDSLMQAFGQEDSRPFRPHVTLARIRDAERSFARRHPIDKDLDLVQMARTVELFQSPPLGATGYRVVASVELRRPDAGTTEMPLGFDHSRLISNSSQE
jgi:2'-5' RNA ligase